MHLFKEILYPAFFDLQSNVFRIMKYSDFVFPISVFMKSMTLDKTVHMSKGDFFKIIATRKFMLSLQYKIYWIFKLLFNKNI